MTKKPMSEEELMMLQREDRRLIELGIDPNLDPAHIYLMLEEMIAKDEEDEEAQRHK